VSKEIATVRDQISPEFATDIREDGLADKSDRTLTNSPSLQSARPTYTA